MEPIRDTPFSFLPLPQRGSRRIQAGLIAQLRQAILSGRLAAGVRVPATRSLAQAIGVSRNTVLATYEQLQAEGYLEAHGAGGTRVAALHQRAPVSRRAAATGYAAAPTDGRRLAPRWQGIPAPAPLAAPPAVRIDLRLGQPELRFFPIAIWNRLHARSLRRLGAAALGYGLDAMGHPRLREQIVQHVSAMRAVACRPEEVMVACGAQQAFDLLARILVNPGRTVVAVEDPGYPLAREAFAAQGARIVGVPVDHDGLVVERIPHGTRVVCLTPSHQFPTGVVLSPPRRAALLRWARSVDGCIVEDDYDSEYRYGGRGLDALKTLDAQDRVFYVGTFSKSLFPALRVGFVVVPPWSLAALAHARRLADWQGAWHTQDALAAFMQEGHLRRHTRRMQRLYAARRDAVLDAVAACSALPPPYPSCAGLHLTLALPPGRSDRAWVAALAHRGVAAEPVSRYRVGLGEPGGLGALALGLGQADVAQIREAMATIVQLLQRPLAVKRQEVVS